jgi:hypothetical protein
MRQRFIPSTAGDMQAWPVRVVAPQRRLACIAAVLRARAVSACISPCVTALLSRRGLRAARRRRARQSRSAKSTEKVRLVERNVELETRAGQASPDRSGGSSMRSSSVGGLDQPDPNQAITGIFPDDLVVIVHLAQREFACKQKRDQSLSRMN